MLIEKISNRINNQDTIQISKRADNTAQCHSSEDTAQSIDMEE